MYCSWMIKTLREAEKPLHIDCMLNIMLCDSSVNHIEKDSNKLRLLQEDLTQNHRKIIHEIRPLQTPVKQTTLSVIWLSLKSKQHLKYNISYLLCSAVKCQHIPGSQWCYKNIIQGCVLIWLWDIATTCAGLFACFKNTRCGTEMELVL